MFLYVVTSCISACINAFFGKICIISSKKKASIEVNSVRNEERPSVAVSKNSSGLYIYCVYNIKALINILYYFDFIIDMDPPVKFLMSY